MKNIIHNNSNLNRRNFLKSTAVLAVSVSVPGFYSCKPGEEPQQSTGCKTTDDILGPFYKANAPFQEDVAPKYSGGTPLIIKGKVYSGCENEIQDAIVEIWNANEDGDYDNEGFLFRGRNKTKEDGSYSFRTIVPGKYLNGAEYRPSHIHFRISAAGLKDLVSQIYFKDDSHISSDSWASSKKAEERILSIEEDENGINMVKFDIHLEKA